MLDAFPTFGARLRFTSEDGEHALFAGPGGLHVRSLAGRRWEEALPDDPPAASIDEGHEQAFLVDPRRGRYDRLLDVVDYPALQATSPDGRFAWVEDKEQSGGVYEVATGLRVLLPAPHAWEQPPFLEREGLLEDEVERPEPPSGSSTAAIALTAADRFRLAAHGAVLDDDEVILRLAAPAPVVAFSRGGEAILVVRRDTASIVDLDPAVLRRTYRLDDLHAALHLDGLPITDEARHALLSRFGGGWELSRVEPAELAAHQELGAEAAEVVAAARREVAAPESVRIVDG